MNKMPINKKEHLVYTFLMVFFMAIVMTIYNITVHHGFSVESIQKAWLVFPITFVLAFLCEWFIVSKIAMTLVHKFIKPEDALIKKITLTALFFVTGMVFLMSFLGSLIFNEYNSDWLITWLKSMPLNFMMAYPLQVLIAGPLISTIFRKLFPLGTIVVPK
jgi:hypothetical protein